MQLLSHASSTTAPPPPTPLLEHFAHPPPSFHLQVHSLTQNTTHRKIRIGPEHQAVLPPFPSAKK